MNDLTQMKTVCCIDYIAKYSATWLLQHALISIITWLPLENEQIFIRPGLSEYGMICIQIQIMIKSREVCS